MKKINNLLVLGLLSLLISCNDYSIIEGVNTKAEPAIAVLPVGTYLTSNPPYSPKGVRFTAYVTSDLGEGRIKVTYTNSLNSDTKILYIEKYYPTSITACTQATESTADFNFSNSTATSVTITVKALSDKEGTWNVVRTIPIGNCSAVKLAL